MESICGCLLLLQSNGDDPTARAAPAASLFLCRRQLRALRVSLSGLFFPASLEGFKSSVLSPSHASLAATSTSTSSRVSRASPSPASLPSNQTFVKPFPSYKTPPPLSPLANLHLPQSASACRYTLSLKMPPQRPTHTRLHVQNTFDALKVLVSRPRPVLPDSRPHSATTRRRPFESARCHSSHDA